MAHKAYSKELVLEAINECHGVILTVAQRLGCRWDTARRYIDKWETTKQAFDNEREKLLDMAESVVFKAIENGDIQTAKWVLATLGRDRGYNERQEIVHSGELENKLTIEFVHSGSSAPGEKLEMDSVLDEDVYQMDTLRDVSKHA